MRIDGALAIHAGIAGLAVVLRVVALGDKPMHSDESVHAFFAWILLQGEGYRYDPVFHGPLQIFLMATSFVLLGASDLSARLVAALAGSAMTVLPYVLRRELGNVGAVAVSALLCVSPSYLYFSRFAREDILFALLTLALIVVAFRFLERPRAWHPSLFLSLGALSLTTKEATYITAAIAASFLAIAAIFAIAGGRSEGARLRDTWVVRSVRSLGARPWIWGALCFAIVFTLLFSTFFTNLGGLKAGLVDSWMYWLSQQPRNFGHQPWFYYVVLLVGYEWPIVLLGLVGAAVALRRGGLFCLFVVWSAALTLAAFSWASERMPWLVLHPLLPCILLAGIGVQALWDQRASRGARAVLAIAAASIFYTVLSAAGLSFLRPADARELLVYTQTAPDVLGVRDDILALDRQDQNSGGTGLSVEIDRSQGENDPWLWYLRDLQRTDPRMADADYRPTAPVLIVSDATRERLLPYLDRYTGRQFRIWVWWIPGSTQPDWFIPRYLNGSVADWLRWLAFREPWSPLGGQDQWLYVRDDVPPLR